MQSNWQQQQQPRQPPVLAEPAANSAIYQHRPHVVCPMLANDRSGCQPTCQQQVCFQEPLSQQQQSLYPSDNQQQQQSLYQLNYQQHQQQSLYQPDFQRQQQQALYPLDYQQQLQQQQQQSMYQPDCQQTCQQTCFQQSLCQSSDCQPNCPPLYSRQWEQDLYSLTEQALGEVGITDVNCPVCQRDQQFMRFRRSLETRPAGQLVQPTTAGCQQVHAVADAVSRILVSSNSRMAAIYIGADLATAPSPLAAGGGGGDVSVTTVSSLATTPASRGGGGYSIGRRERETPSYDISSRATSPASLSRRRQPNGDNRIAAAAAKAAAAAAAAGFTSVQPRRLQQQPLKQQPQARHPSASSQPQLQGRQKQTQPQTKAAKISPASKPSRAAATATATATAKAAEGGKSGTAAAAAALGMPEPSDASEGGGATPRPWTSPATDRPSHPEAGATSKSTATSASQTKSAAAAGGSTAAATTADEPPGKTTIQLLRFRDPELSRPGMLAPRRLEPPKFLSRHRPENVVSGSVGGIGGGGGGLPLRRSNFSNSESVGPPAELRLFSEAAERQKQMVANAMHLARLIESSYGRF